MATASINYRYSVNGKVALITGGTSGIGFATSRQLLLKHLKGVVIIGTDKNKGENARNKLAAEFGMDKVVYIQADVSIRHQLDDAFKRTISIYKQLDIVMNCAGISTEQRRTIDVNLNGTINGSMLALDEYLLKYKSGTEGVLINISSVAALKFIEGAPMFTATKGAVLLFTRALASPKRYHENGIRILTICPGLTNTPFMKNYKLRSGQLYQDLIFKYFAENPISQSAEYVGKAITEVIIQGENGSVWVPENGTTINVNLFTRKQNVKHLLLLY